MRRRARLVMALTGLLAVGSVGSTGCTSGTGEFAGPPVQHPARVVYLDVQDGETLVGPSSAGIAATLLERTMPALATFYEADAFGSACYVRVPSGCGGGLSASAATLDRAVRSLSPTVATVEVGMGPLAGGVSAGTFGDMLGRLVRRLHADGTRTVLVSNLPSWNLAPQASSLVSLGRGIAAYNAAIAAVASRDRAVLVDVHAVIERAIARRGSAAVFASALGFNTAPFALSGYAWGLVEGAYVQAIAGRPVAAERAA